MFIQSWNFKKSTSYLIWKFITLKIADQSQRLNRSKFAIFSRVWLILKFYKIVSKNFFKIIFAVMWILFNDLRLYAASCWLLKFTENASLLDMKVQCKVRKKKKGGTHKCVFSGRILGPRTKACLNIEYFANWLPFIRYIAIKNQ